MDDKRQNIQLELAFMAEPWGEALRTSQQGTESPIAERQSESPTGNGLRMEQVVSAYHLMFLTCLTSRTAVYGPVRTVVWEEQSRKALPYPARLPPSRGHSYSKFDDP